MKTLLEHILNELKIADASTGNRLEEKTFAELKKGDYFYCAILGRGRNYIEKCKITSIRKSGDEVKFGLEYKDRKYTVSINQFEMNLGLTTSGWYEKGCYAACVNAIHNNFPESQDAEIVW